jgi:protein gp37
VSETSIEWTRGSKGGPGYTLNPWLGCAKAHAGCTNCYAEKHQAVNMRKGGKVQWGEVWQGGQRVATSASTMARPFQWAREAAAADERRRVFCASLGDVLEVPDMPPFARLTADLREAVNRARAQMDRQRALLWEVIWGTSRMCPECGPLEEAEHDRDCDGPRHIGFDAPGLDWLLLTKRPENWALVPEHIRPLVWLGTSISDQRTADEWVPRLLAAEGFRYRFLSVEPLVGPVDLTRLLRVCPACDHVGPVGAGFVNCCPDGGAARRIDWVIVGGESGSKARPCNVEWVRSIVRQCREAGVPCFVKQLGAEPSVAANEAAGMRRRGTPGAWRLALNDPKGGDWAEWPEDLRVREFPP